jgi:hypothetical protein
MSEQPLIDVVDEDPSTGKRPSLNDDELAEGDQLALDRLKPGPGTIFGSVFNVANCAIGSGVLAFPWCLKCCGLVPGTILIFFFAVSGYITSIFSDFFFTDLAWWFTACPGVCVSTEQCSVLPTHPSSSARRQAWNLLPEFI